MIKYKDECCSCVTDNYPCMGSECPNLRVKHYICDKCKSEVDKLYLFDGDELCEECVLDSLEIVE